MENIINLKVVTNNIMKIIKIVVICFLILSMSFFPSILSQKSLKYGTRSFFETDYNNSYEVLWCDGIGIVDSADLSPDSKHIVVGGDIVAILNSTTLELEKKVFFQRPYKDNLKWSPDGKKIAARFFETIKIYDYVNNGITKIINSGDGEGLDWSPDSNKIIYVTKNQSIFIIDIETEQIVNKRKNPTIYTPVGFYSLQGITNLISWSPDGSKIAIASYSFDPDGEIYDGNIFILNANNGSEIFNITTPKIKSLLWNSDNENITYLKEYHHGIIGEKSEYLEILNTFNESIFFSISEWSEDYFSLINSFTINQKNNKIAILFYNRIEIWKINPKELQQSINLTEDEQNCQIILYINNTNILIGNKNLKIINTNNRIFIKSISISNTGNICEVKFTPDGEKIVTCGEEGTLIQKPVNGEILKKIDEPGNCLAINSDSSKMAIGNYGGMITIWDLNTYSKIKTLKSPVIELPQKDKWSKYYKYPIEISSLSFNHDGTKIATGYSTSEYYYEKYEFTIRIWNLTTGEIIDNFTCKKSVLWLDWSSDDRHLVSLYRDWNPKIKIWDTYSRKIIKEFYNSSYEILSPTWVGDDLIVAGYNNYNHNITIWNITSGEQLQDFSSNISNVISLSWSRDNKNLYGHFIKYSKHQINMWNIYNPINENIFNDNIIVSFDHNSTQNIIISAKSRAIVAWSLFNNSQKNNTDNLENSTDSHKDDNKINLELNSFTLAILILNIIIISILIIIIVKKRHKK